MHLWVKGSIQHPISGYTFETSLSESLSCSDAVHCSGQFKGYAISSQLVAAEHSRPTGKNYPDSLIKQLGYCRPNARVLLWSQVRGNGA